MKHWRLLALAFCGLLAIPLIGQAQVPVVGPQTYTFTAGSQSNVWTCNGGQSSFALTVPSGLTGTFTVTVGQAMGSATSNPPWSYAPGAAAYTNTITNSGSLTVNLGSNLYVKVADTSYSSGSVTVTGVCSGAVAVVPAGAYSSPWPTISGSPPITVTNPTPGTYVATCGPCVFLQPSASPVPQTSGYAYANLLAPSLPVYNVLANGVKGNGTTDDTTAIQSVLTLAGTTCGAVFFPVALYYTTGTLTIPQCVTVTGPMSGPFDFPIGSSPGTSALAPTFLVTSGSGNASGTAFMTLDGNDVVENVAFYYPNQVPISATTPTAYPWTIQFAASNSQGNIVRRDTFINSYQAILTHAGRSHVEHNMIGAYSQAITVDGSADTTWVTDNHITPVWDLIFNGGVAPGSPIDTWVQANQIGMQFLRADSNVVANNVQFTGNIGTDIGSPGSSHVDSWGNATNNYLEGVNIGIRANTSGNVGWVFADTYIESFHNYSVQLNTPAPGDADPIVSLTGGGWQGYGGASTTPQVNDASAELYTNGINGYSLTKTYQGQLQVTLLPTPCASPDTNATVICENPSGYTTFINSNGNGAQFINPSASPEPVNAGNFIVPPANTATNITNYGSVGSFQPCWSDWTGSSASTLCWTFATSSTGSLIVNYNGARYFTITSSGGVTFNNNASFTVGSVGLLFAKGQASCALSGTSSCNTTASVPSGATCTGSYDHATTVALADLVPLTASASSTTLTLYAVTNASLTGTIYMDYTCL